MLLEGLDLVLLSCVPLHWEALNEYLWIIVHLEERAWRAGSSWSYIKLFIRRTMGSLQSAGEHASAHSMVLKQMVWASGSVALVCLCYLGVMSNEDLGFYFCRIFPFRILILVFSNGVVLGENPLEWSTKPNRIYRFILLATSSLFIIPAFLEDGGIQCPDLRVKTKFLLQHKALGQRPSLEEEHCLALDLFWVNSGTIYLLRKELASWFWS